MVKVLELSTARLDEFVETLQYLASNYPPDAKLRDFVKDVSQAHVLYKLTHKRNKPNKKY